MTKKFLKNNYTVTYLNKNNLCYIIVRFQECYCCRETFLRERIITLTHCYDPDGMRLTSEKLATLEVKLREPADCKCFKCGDFSG